MSRRKTTPRSGSMNREAPSFTLLGEDPLSPKLVMIWACVKNGDLAGALDEFNAIAQDIIPEFEENPIPDDAVQEAVAIAEAMEGGEDDD